MKTLQKVSGDILFKKLFILFFKVKVHFSWNSCSVLIVTTIEIQKN